MLRSLYPALFLLLLALPVGAANPFLCPELEDPSWQPASYNHVLEAAEGGYEVLLPREDGSFKVAKVSTRSEAHMLALSIREPVNLREIIDSRTPELENLLVILREFRRANGMLTIAARTKEAASLKKKIFDRVRKHGDRFRLTDIDDVVGARLSVESRSEVEIVAQHLKSVPELTVVKFERIEYERGYRAIHLTVRIESGAVFEIQIMTRRMQAWVEWNAKRVYKPRVPTNTPYFERLLAYDRELVTYLNALDDGVAGAAAPDFESHRLRPEDKFESELRR